MTIENITDFIAAHQPTSLQIHFANEFIKVILASIDAYSQDEVDIIDHAQKCYRDIFGVETYPIYLQYLDNKKANEAKDNTSDMITKLSKNIYPAIKLGKNTVYFDNNKHGDNAIAGEVGAIINRLITYYNKSNDKIIKSTSNAVRHIFLYLIDIFYGLSNATLEKSHTLKQVDQYLNFIKQVMVFEKLKKRIHQNEHTDAQNVIAAVFKMLIHIRKIVEKCQSNLTASTALLDIADNSKKLCEDGFKLAVLLSAGKKVDNMNVISLPEIRMVKENQDTKKIDSTVRKYAEKDGKSTVVEGFFCGLSNSLLKLLDSKDSKPEDIFVNLDHLDQLNYKKSDFYTPFKDTDFTENFRRFCMDLENIALLQEDARANSKIAGSGALIYFLVSGHVAEDFISQIYAVLASFDRASKFLMNAADARNTVIYRLKNKSKETSEDLAWAKLYTMIQKNAMLTPIHNSIEKITQSCSSLRTQLHEFKDSPEAKIYEFNDACRAIKERGSNIHKHLHRNGYNVSAAPSQPAASTLSILPQLSLFSSRVQVRTPHSMRSETFFSAPKLNIFLLGEKPKVFWDYFDESEVSEFKDSFTHGIIGTSLDFQNYLRLEKPLIAKIQSNDEYKPTAILEELKQVQASYEKIDEILKKAKSKLVNSAITEDKKQLDFVYHLRIEIAFRQIKLAAEAVRNNKVSINQFHPILKAMGENFEKKYNTFKSGSKNFSESRQKYKNILGAWAVILKNCSKEDLILLARSKSKVSRDLSQQPGQTSTADEIKFDWLGRQSGLGPVPNLPVQFNSRRVTESDNEMSRLLESQSRSSFESDMEAVEPGNCSSIKILDSSAEEKTTMSSPMILARMGECEHLLNNIMNNTSNIPENFRKIYRAKSTKIFMQYQIEQIAGNVTLEQKFCMSINDLNARGRINTPALFGGSIQRKGFCNRLFHCCIGRSKATPSYPTISEERFEEVVAEHAKLVMNFFTINKDSNYEALETNSNISSRICKGA